MMFPMFLILFSIIFKEIECTIDLSLGHLEYIANQLTPLECEKLDKYLHARTFEVTTNKIDFSSFTENTCLEILIHWNSSPSEGLGNTHAYLAHRLNQIGRRDLADWLSNIIFSRLGMSLKKSVLANPFKDLLPESSTISEAELEAPGNNSDLSLYKGEPDWETYDTVAVILATLLLLAIIFMIFEFCGCFKYFQKIRKREKYLNKNKYTLLPQEDSPLTAKDENANEA